MQQITTLKLFKNFLNQKRKLSYTNNFKTYVFDTNCITLNSLNTMKLQTVTAAISSKVNAAFEKLKSVTTTEANETRPAFEVELSVPGLDKKDVSIEVQNDCLIVSSRKEFRNETNNKQYTRREYAYTAFRRVFRLPQNADIDRIKASMKNGILSIRVFEQHDHDGYLKLIPVR